MNKFKIVCCQKNQGKAICVTSTCAAESGAIICQDQNCQCVKDEHKQCSLSISSDKLLQAINVKGKSSIPTLEFMVEWYQKMIKQFTVQKQEILKIIDEPQLILTLKQKNLYQKLKDESFKEITGKLAFDTLCQLSNFCMIKQVENKSTALKNICFELEKKIKNVINYVRNFESLQSSLIPVSSSLQPLHSSSNQPKSMFDKPSISEMPPSFFQQIFTHPKTR